MRLFVVLVLFSACTDEPPTPPSGDSQTGDTVAGDPGTGDPGTSGDPGAGGDVDEDDFAIRLPLPHVMTCDGGTGPSTFRDTDHLCAVPSLDVEVYIQATPTSCVTLIADRPYFDDVTGWVKRNGEVSEIAAAYDAGHHNSDVIHFEIDGTVYFIWHSSLGYGGWACAPPDCLMTCGGGATFETCGPSGGATVDGCARNTGDPPPPAPVICVQIETGGAVPELLDPWDDAPGDPYPLLPCPGDI